MDAALRQGAGRAMNNFRITLACLTLSLSAAAAAEEESGPWQYVVPGDADAGFTPPALTLSLLSEKPEAIQAAPPAVDGAQRSYALLRYGSPNSPQLPIVLDKLDGGEFTLTIDLSRSGQMADARPVAGSGRSRQLEIKSAITYAERAADEYPRQVQIRRSASGKSLSVVTLGYLSGSVRADGRTIAARRVDGNATGLFADPQERLWPD